MSLPHLPASGRWLRLAGSIGAHAAAPDKLTLLARDRLVGPFAHPLAAGEDPLAQAVACREAIDALEARGALVLGYCSARDGAERHGPERYLPPRCVETAARCVALREKRSGVWELDYRHAATRGYLLREIPRLAADWWHAIFLDNVSHPHSGWRDERGQAIGWKTTCDYLGDLVARLHERGVAVVVNLAWNVAASAAVDDELGDLGRLLDTGADGVALEMPWHASVRGNVELTRRGIGAYRRLLDAGRLVWLIGGADAAAIDQRDIDQRLVAGLAMLVREAGDRLYCASDWWRPAPDWADWPLQLGRPLTPPACTAWRNDGPVWSRAFERGRIEVEPAASACRVIWGPPR